MRSMWKGSISFGLVTIPVKLYAATESKDVRFNLLHDECRTPVQYRKWCVNCNREVQAGEIVRGYEYERGRYVVVRDEDLEGIPIAAARTLDIVDFVRLEQIDPIYFEKTYYLEPGEGGAKAYALLRRAMEETGRIAVARVVIRSKESLAAIRVFKNGVLAMETMHFPDEVRSPAGLNAIAEPEIRPQELEMATNLVASLSRGEFVPEKFENQYRQAVIELINARVAGDDIVQVERPAERGRVVDLMDALRASIRQAEVTRGAGPGGEAGRAPGPGVPGTVPAGGGAPGVPAGVGAPGIPGAPGGAPGRPPGPGAAAIPVVPGVPVGVGAPGVPGAVPGAPGFGAAPGRAPVLPAAPGVPGFAAPAVAPAVPAPGAPPGPAPGLPPGGPG